MISSDNDSNLTKSPACRFDPTILGVLYKSNCNIDCISFRRLRNKMYLHWMTSKNQNFPPLCARHFRDQKKIKWKRKGKGKRNPFLKKVSKAWPSLLVWWLAFHPTKTRRAWEWRKWNMKLSAHTNSRLLFAASNDPPLQTILSSSTLISSILTDSFDSLSLKTAPRDGFYTFLLQVPTERHKPEIERQTRTANVIAMKKRNTGPLLKVMATDTNKLGS